jgi:hypothetical protein
MILFRTTIVPAVMRLALSVATALQFEIHRHGNPA